MPYQLIYTSRIIAHLEPIFIPELVKKARVRNRLLGITGMLAFDGEHFCQLLEGEADVVLHMAAVIQSDVRHDNYAVLQAGPHTEPRLFPGWHMAFGLHDGNTLQAAIARCSGREVAAYLQSMPPSRIDSDPE